MKDLYKYLTEGMWTTSWTGSNDMELATDDKGDPIYYLGSGARNEIGTMKDIEKMAGKDADRNGSGGVWEIDAPEDDDIMDETNPDPQTLSMNEKLLKAKFATREDFFIEGKAGWAKTALVMNLAKRYRRKVCTVYLDKAMATDLGGIPIPSRDAEGRAFQEFALPGWAAYIIEHPNDEFLLFFDEMNQAQPDVMNALMPIVLKHEICGHKCKNFIVGAAGNLEEENRQGVSQLSAPLKARFDPIIRWETNTAETWNSSFNFLHRKYDNVLGKEFIDTLNNNRDLFESPRDIERTIFKFVANAKEDVQKDPKEADLFDSRLVLKRLEEVISKNLSRTDKDKITALADYISEYIKGSNKQTKTRRSTKNRIMMDQKDVDDIRNAIEQGFIIGEDGERYGVCRENVFYIINPDIYPRETIENFIEKLEADGVKFKYETKKECAKDTGLEVNFE